MMAATHIFGEDVAHKTNVTMRQNSSAYHGLRQSMEMTITRTPRHGRIITTKTTLGMSARYLLSPDTPSHDASQSFPLVLTAPKRQTTAMANSVTLESVEHATVCILVSYYLGDTIRVFW